MSRPEPPSPGRPKHVAAQIADHVRDLIASGRLRPGDRLPSSQELAAEWKTHPATVHGALTPLVRQGLISRVRRRGTVVESREARFERLAVYLAADVWREREGSFVRSLCAALHAVMRARGGALDAWIDARPRHEQASPWRELVEAARRRKVQAVVAPRTDEAHLRWLRKLPVATAFVTGHALPNGLSFDAAQLARDSVAELARQGCRRAGYITVHRSRALDPDGSARSDALFHATFRAAASERGLVVSDAWAQSPGRGYVPEERAERFGYEAFGRIWRGRSRPDGLFVFTDIVARGVLMALAERSVVVPDELRLVLHRNDAVGLLCPYPASFMDVHVSDVARRLVEMVEAGLRGGEVGPAVVPYVLARSRARRSTRSKGGQR